MVFSHRNFVTSFPKDENYRLFILLGTWKQIGKDKIWRWQTNSKLIIFCFAQGMKNEKTMHNARKKIYFEKFPAEHYELIISCDRPGMVK